jgi:hypothetical protein
VERCLSFVEDAAGTVDVITEVRCEDARGLAERYSQRRQPNVGAERLLGYAAADVVNKITSADIWSSRPRAGSRTSTKFGEERLLELITHMPLRNSLTACRNPTTSPSLSLKNVGEPFAILKTRMWRFRTVPRRLRSPPWPERPKT